MHSIFVQWLKIWSFVCLLIFISSGCASVLSSRYQKINVVSHEPGGEIKIEDSFYSNDTIRVKVTKQTQFITATKEGYLDNVKVIYPSKRSPLLALNFGVPLAVVCYAMATQPDVDPSVGLYALLYGIGGYSIDNGLVTGDIANKTRRFKKDTIHLDKQVKIVEREDHWKYLETDISELDLDTGDITAELFIWSHRYFRGKPGRPDENDEVLSENSYGLTETLNEMLKKHGLVDTSSRYFAHNADKLLIDCVVDKIHILSVGSTFTQAQLEINWKLKTPYGDSLFGQRISTTGNPIDPFTISSEVIIEALNSALEKSLMSFIGSQNVLDIYQNTKLDDDNRLNVDTVVTLSYSELSNTKVSHGVKSVVTIIGQNGHGSGCIVSSDGLIVTNFHVIDKQMPVTIRLSNGAEYSCEIVRADSQYDLALLRIDTTGLRCFDLRSEPGNEIGSEVYSIGTPTNIELGQTVSKGIISGKREFDGNIYIQTDAAINGGNSGGALSTSTGQLIGIVNAKLAGFGIEGIGFAIPIETVKQRLKLE